MSEIDDIFAAKGMGKPPKTALHISSSIEGPKTSNKKRKRAAEGQTDLKAPEIVVVREHKLDGSTMLHRLPETAQLRIWYPVIPGTTWTMKINDLYDGLEIYPPGPAQQLYDGLTPEQKQYWASNPDPSEYGLPIAVRYPWWSA